MPARKIEPSRKHFASPLFSKSSREHISLPQLLQMNIDYFLFQQINNLAGHSVCLDSIAIFLASYFQYILAGSLALFLVIGKDKPAKIKNLKMVALAFLAAIVSRYVFGQIIKLVVARPRPSDLHQVTQLIPFDSFGSFPSGHMAFLFALSIVIYFYNKKAGWLLFAGSFLIGLARIYVGIHYPLDILGGMILGILIGWLTIIIFEKWCPN